MGRAFRQDLSSCACNLERAYIRCGRSEGRGRMESIAAARSEDASNHPTAAERFFFDNNGYLLLEEFLPAERIAALNRAVERAIARRTAPDYRREHPPAFPGQLSGPNYRLFHL